MADNQLKTSFANALNNLAYARALNVASALGKALPCSVVKVADRNVTVKFEMETDQPLSEVTIPVAYSEYVRLPIQPGDKGLAIPGDVSIGDISGLGGSISNFNPIGNLQALVFHPISRQAFQSEAGDYVTLYGPTGVLAKTKDGKNFVKVNGDGVRIQKGSDVYVNVVNDGVTIYCHGIHIVVNAQGIEFHGPVSAWPDGGGAAITINGDINIIGTMTHTGTYMNNSINMTEHVHGGVQSGGSSTDVPKNGGP
jgi:hypothetical protein